MTFPATQPEPVATEPPEEKVCVFCDGQGTVNAIEVESAMGEVFAFRYACEEMAVPCPICKLGMVLNGTRLEG